MQNNLISSRLTLHSYKYSFPRLGFDAFVKASYACLMVVLRDVIMMVYC